MLQHYVVRRFLNRRRHLFETLPTETPCDRWNYQQTPGSLSGFMTESSEPAHAFNRTSASSAISDYASSSSYFWFSWSMCNAQTITFVVSRTTSHSVMPSFQHYVAARVVDAVKPWFHVKTRNSSGDEIANVNFLRRHHQPLLRTAPRKLPNSWNK